MPLLGAHMSTAGGLHKAAERAAALGMDTVQIFSGNPRQWAVRGGPSPTGGPDRPLGVVQELTKNNAQWRAKPITDGEVDAFRAAVSAGRLEMPCSHASYLINLASPNGELWSKSGEAFAIELERAERLGLVGVVVHPGTATGIDEGEGIDNVVRALNAAVSSARSERVEVWLEATAGQGASLGHRFEQLAEILDRVERPERYGVCLDTCHIFAAGYPLRTREEFDETFAAFDRTVGFPRLRAVHLNDSKKPCGSRVDRHEHIGEGCLGLEPFRHLLNDPRFTNLPMYLETAKGSRDGMELDAVNLKTLQSLIETRPVG